MSTTIMSTDPLTGLDRIILDPTKIVDTDFKDKFAHFLTRTSTVYAKGDHQLLTDRGIESPLLDGLLAFLPSGAIIGGGFMTAILSQEDTAGDIDVFFTSKESFVTTVNLLLNPPEDTKAWAYKGYKLKEPNDLDNVNRLRFITFIHPTRPALQLLRMVWYESPEAVIDSFDLSIAQFAADATGFYYNPLSFIDLSRKRVVLHRMQFPASTLRRIIKYSKKGYYACPGALGKICEEIQKFTGQTDVNAVVYVD